MGLPLPSYKKGGYRDEKENLFYPFLQIIDDFHSQTRLLSITEYFNAFVSLTPFPIIKNGLKLVDIATYSSTFCSCCH